MTCDGDGGRGNVSKMQKYEWKFRMDQRKREKNEWTNKKKTTINKNNNGEVSRLIIEIAPINKKMNWDNIKREDWRRPARKKDAKKNEAVRSRLE